MISTHWIPISFLLYSSWFFSSCIWGSLAYTFDFWVYFYSAFIYLYAIFWEKFWSRASYLCVLFPSSRKESIEGFPLAPMFSFPSVYFSLILSDDKNLEVLSTDESFKSLRSRQTSELVSIKMFPMLWLGLAWLSIWEGSKNLESVSLYLRASAVGVPGVPGLSLSSK